MDRIYANHRITLMYQNNAMISIFYKRINTALSLKNKLFFHLVIIWYNMESHIEVMNLYLHIYGLVMQSAIEVNLLTYTLARIIGPRSSPFYIIIIT